MNMQGHVLSNREEELLQVGNVPAVKMAGVNWEWKGLWLTEQ